MLKGRKPETEFEYWLTALEEHRACAAKDLLEERMFGKTLFAHLRHHYASCEASQLRVERAQAIKDIQVYWSLPFGLTQDFHKLLLIEEEMKRRGMHFERYEEQRFPEEPVPEGEATDSRGANAG